MSLRDLVDPPRLPTKRGRIVSSATEEDGDGRKSKAHAERAAERMRKLHADPEFEARRIAAIKAAASRRKE